MLPEGVRVRMLHAVYGDPRAAAEAVPRLTERQTSGHDPLPTDPAELAPALLHAHRAEIRALPDDTRLLLLLAAADQYPVATHAFLRATAAARLDTRPLERAETAGIAHAGAGGVVFRDAWTRIAAYETGSPADRREVHRLLARVLRADGETPRRSWHRGAGALGPSGRLTSELRAAADQARTAGQLTLARALVERAATLSPDRTETARLLARAATDAWHAGDGDRARRLAATAAHDDALAGLFALRAGNATEAFDALVAAAVQRGGGGEGHAEGNGSTGTDGGGGAAPPEGGTTAAGFGVGGISERPPAPLDGGPPASVPSAAEGRPETRAPGSSDDVSPGGRVDAGLSGRSGGAGRGVGMSGGPGSAAHASAGAADAEVSVSSRGWSDDVSPGGRVDAGSSGRSGLAGRGVGMSDGPGSAAHVSGGAADAEVSVGSRGPVGGVSPGGRADAARPGRRSGGAGRGIGMSDRPGSAVHLSGNADEAAVSTPAPGPADGLSSGRRVAAPLPGQSAAADRRVGTPRHSDSAVHLLARATEAAVYTGDLRRSREALRVAGRLGVGPPGALGGLVAAVEGRYEDARDLLRVAAGHGEPGDDPALLVRGGSGIDRTLPVYGGPGIDPTPPMHGPGADPTLLVHAGIAALMLGDHTLAATATVRAVSSARARGATATVVQALEFRAYADFWTGRPHAGAATALDALRQAYATGQDNGACHLQAALAMFAALTGDEDTCRERAAAARSYALTHGLGLPAALAQWALAHLDLAAGRFAGAAARLRALAGFGPGHGHRAIRHLATPHYVEAAVRTGDTRVARAAHADYDRWASAVRSPDDLALSARCRALLAPGAEAVEHYRAALDLHAHGTRDFERARTELLFGGALRRLRRRTEARDRLHSALEAFDSFGAPHCAAQARAELRALGAPATPSHPAAVDPTARLTAQQLLIARMAADGATNREIAGRLALSPRTIDHHLRGVFTRLGIRSRIDLVRLLGGGGDTRGTA
ncbi:LuxR C-terminal-related transcriptional regulator [Streptomyces sp. NPDC092369]|uniref:LuxR C-terminal-related transcriptional regulator n=1 Tax=Streptomyces sp. NPDC092369 TaxID=3366015 RepID=UPI003809A576